MSSQPTCQLVKMNQKRLRWDSSLKVLKGFNVSQGGPMSDLHLGFQQRTFDTPRGALIFNPSDFIFLHPTWPSENSLFIPSMMRLKSVTHSSMRCCGRSKTPINCLSCLQMINNRNCLYTCHSMIVYGYTQCSGFCPKVDSSTLIPRSFHAKSCSATSQTSTGSGGYGFRPAAAWMRGKIWRNCSSALAPPQLDHLTRDTFFSCVFSARSG